MQLITGGTILTHAVHSEGTLFEAVKFTMYFLRYFVNLKRLLSFVAKYISGASRAP